MSETTRATKGPEAPVSDPAVPVTNPVTAPVISDGHKAALRELSALRAILSGHGIGYQGVLEQHRESIAALAVSDDGTVSDWAGYQPPPVTIPVTTPARPVSSPQGLTIDEIKQMTPEQCEARLPEIRAALAASH